MTQRPYTLTVLTTTLIALLAACSGGSDGGKAEGETAATATEVIPLDPQDSPQPETVTETLANRIPTRFQGVWDYVEGTCSPESDLRMEVSGGEILFYESIGMVTDVEAEGEDVVVSLAMEGEGETWEQELRLALVGTGEAQLLETSDGAKPRAADEYPNKRCPE